MSKQVFISLTESEKQFPLYITGVGYDFNEGYIHRPKGFPEYQWIQCHSGSGYLEIEQEKYHITEGMGMFLLSNEGHTYYTDTQWTSDWISFDGEAVKQLMKAYQITSSKVFHLKDVSSMSHTVLNLLHTLQHQSYAKHFEASGMLYQLMIQVFNHTLEETHHEENNRLNVAIEYIKTHYDQVIAIDTLADMCQITPQHFCVLFKELYQQRPLEYINKLRIQESKNQIIASPSLSVKEVGQRVGFEHPSYFGKVFKSLEGMTPNQFKKLYIQK